MEAVLEVHLTEWEKEYGNTSEKAPLGARFGQILKAAYNKTGKKCVVLREKVDI